MRTVVRTGWGVLAALALTLTACEQPLEPEALKSSASANSESAVSRPVQGSLHTDRVVIGPSPAILPDGFSISDCGGTLPVPVYVHAEGTLSHLGTVEVEGAHCTERSLTPLPVDFGRGVSIWTAANGDQLYANYEGTQTKFVEPGVVVAFEVTYTITGGTGRFAGASGQLSSKGTLNLNTFTADEDLSGQITY